MPRSYSQQEREEIRKSLMENCEACWNTYGFQKTTVAQLCKQSGISSGAFYIFYASKELLFLDTAQTIIRRLFSVLENGLPEQATKEDFSAAFRAMVEQMRHTPCYLTMNDDFKILVRNLSVEQLKKYGRSDTEVMMSIIKKKGLTPTVSEDILSTVLKTLVFIPLTQHYVTCGKDFDQSHDLIIENVVAGIFK